MNEENKKPVLTPNNIAIATMAILIMSHIVTLAYLAGAFKTTTDRLAQEVDKWDENVITLNKEMSALQHGN